MEIVSIHPAAKTHCFRPDTKYYAAGLEKMTGQRPVIFFTNGYDLFIWDDSKNEPPRKIYGFHSKDSLQYLNFQNEPREPLLAHLTPSALIVDRLYQVEAIKRICERFDARKRRALLVQATGTGKTRVAVALCELLIRAKWGKRVLFLCDRRELRKQAHDVFQEYLPVPRRLMFPAQRTRIKPSAYIWPPIRP
jgi:type I restriction enzyme R subunit